MRRRITWLVLLAIVAPSPAGGAAAQELSPRERFELLFNECRPMKIVVEEFPYPAEAADIDLTEAAIQATVELRLRSARLYDADAYSHIYVYVNVVNVNLHGGIFERALQYRRFVYDAVAAESSLATTRYLGSEAGPHAGSAAYILVGIADSMDSFLVAYLRVNESACD